MDLGIVTVLELLHAAYNLTGSQLTVACDNLTAGQKSLMATEPVPVNQDQHNLLRLIRG